MRVFKQLLSVMTVYLLVGAMFGSQVTAQEGCLPDYETIGIGMTVTGTITAANDMQWYCLEITSEDRVTVDMIPGDDSVLDPLLMLYEDIEGEPAYVTENDFYNFFRVDARLTFEATAGNVYYISATRSAEERGDTAGDYELSVISDNMDTITAPDDPDLQCNPPFEEIAANETINGTIERADEIKSWCIVGRAGERFTVTAEVTSGDLDTRVIIGDFDFLIDPDNEGIADERVYLTSFDSEPGTGATLSYTLPYDGVYSVFVVPSDVKDGATRGEFTMTLEVDPAPADMELACDSGQWAMLTEVTWRLGNENPILFDFNCSSVTMNFDDTSTTYAYDYTGDVLSILINDDVTNRWESVIISEGLLLAMAGEGDEAGLIRLFGETDD